MKQYLGLRGKQLSRAALFLVVSPAFLCYGYNQAVLGGVLTLDSFVEAFPAMDTVHTEGQQQTKNANIQGTIVALYLVGGIFGALSCTQLGDKIGRRGVILISSGITLIGAILMASSYSLAQFIVARLVLGLGVGGTTATVVSLQLIHLNPSTKCLDWAHVRSLVMLPCLSANSLNWNLQH
jgi:MFS family permease